MLDRPEVRAALWAGWRAALEEFGDAREQCARSFTEKHVHHLRVAARRCVPVLQVLERMDPMNGLWRLARHGARDLLRVLGPLRDAQVGGRHASAVQKDGGRVAALHVQAKAAERIARRTAKAAFQVVQGMPVRPLARMEKSLMHADTAVWADALWPVLDEAAQELRAHWRPGGRATPAHLHEVRVALKRYRYVLLALGPGLPRALRSRSAKLERIQTQFGAWHDDHVLLERARAAGLRDGLEALVASEAQRRKAALALLRGPAPC